MGSTAVPLDSSEVAVEGVMRAAFEFSGPSTSSAADSLVRSWRAPRRSPTPPGIDPTRIPSEPAPKK
jgi:hypothetical protein